MIPIARIQGIPRVRQTHNLNPGIDLQNRIENSTRTARMYAPVGVIGFPKSGRKTLAHRFERMEEGTFIQEVPVKNIYATSIEGEINPPQSNQRFVLVLKFYIINNFPPYRPPCFSLEWNDFCCMIAIFDVTESTTFYAVPEYLTHMMGHSFNIQRNFLIVGNKSDLRRSCVTRSCARSEVSVNAAERMASHFEGTYFECSAKKPENVWPLLAAIKNFGAKKRYERN